MADVCSPSAPLGEEWLETFELAARLRRCERTLRNMVLDGRLPPPRRIGGRKVLWSWNEVARVLCRGQSA